MYRIRWYAPKTGQTGTGTGTFPKAEAQHYADELNNDPKSKPFLIHSIERADHDRTRQTD